MLFNKGYTILFILCLFWLHTEGSESVNYKEIYPIKITEVCSHNTSLNKNEKGNYADWIELFNYGKNKIDLEGLYLTDNINNLTKFKIESDSSLKKETLLHKNSYKLFWCDNDKKQGPKHTNFKINALGDFIAIIAPDGQTIIDSMTIPPLNENTSFGRISIGKRKYFFSQPTPNRKNNNGKLYRCEKPKTNLTSGFYFGEQRLQIKSPKAQFQINGGIVKTAENPSLKIDSIQTFKILSSDSHCVKSNPTYKSIFINTIHNVPVISLHIDTTHLWNKFYGIHAGRNYKRKLVRDAYIELFNSKGKLVEKANVEINIHGAYSRTYPQKSIAIKIADDSPKKHFEYPLFSSVKNEKYKSFILRNSGNDWLNTRMKDVLCQSLIDVDYLDVNTQAYEPCVLYVNGTYFGLYNMREKINSDYLKYTYGVRKKNVEIIEKHNYPIKGKNNNFNQLMNYISKESFTKKKNLDTLNSHIDLKNYIDYQAIQIYTGNKDWPQNNVKCWRESKHSKQWHWLIYDMDETFKDPTINSVDIALGLDTNRVSKFDLHYTRATQILPKIIKNKQIKHQLVSRLFDLMNFTFGSARVNHFVDSLKRKMSPEMGATLNFWYPQHSMYKKMKRTNYFSSWYNNVKHLKTFIPKRNVFLIENLKQRNWINNLIEFSIEFDSQKYQVLLNGIEIKSTQNTYFYPKNIPPSVSIIPKTSDKILLPDSWIRIGTKYKITKAGNFQIN